MSCVARRAACSCAMAQGKVTTNISRMSRSGSRRASVKLVRAAELEQEGMASLKSNMQEGKEKSLGKNPMHAAQSREEPGQRLAPG